ncbi:MAG: hypothetical protein U5L06_00780 [Rhodovibrio sp.]|nr:hypothetical protein [Rhodovibrio sp.]
MDPNALHAVLILCAIIAICGVAAMIADGYRRMMRDKDNHDHAGRHYACGPYRGVTRRERR